MEGGSTGYAGSPSAVVHEELMYMVAQGSVTQISTLASGIDLHTVSNLDTFAGHTDEQLRPCVMPLLTSLEKSMRLQNKLTIVTQSRL